jgi:hypothetical protein
MPDQRDPDPTRRRAQRVLLMVHELHKRGYQRVRLVPGMAPSGLHWRCAVTHRGNILTTHGAMAKTCDHPSASYSSSQDNGYFGWEDAHQDTARQLAVKFLERFPAIVRRGQGLDWLYICPTREQRLDLLPWLVPQSIASHHVYAPPAAHKQCITI